MSLFEKMYNNAYFRIPFKFGIAFVISKITVDYVHYKGMGIQFGLMRTNIIYGGQNPINPPLPKPYPQADTYQHLQQIKAYNQYTRKIVKSVKHSYNYHDNIYIDHPCRQNPDIIDHFIQFGNIHRIKQIINYSFINQLKKQGIEIPEGINQKIRQLSQYKLNLHTPIVPQL